MLSSLWLSQAMLVHEEETYETLFDPEQSLMIMDTDPKRASSE